MPARVTQEFVEVLQTNAMSKGRVTQSFVEVLEIKVNTNNRVTQHFTEILQRNRYCRGRATQYYVEVLHPIATRAILRRLRGIVLKAKVNAFVVPFRAIFLIPKGNIVTQNFIELLRIKTNTRVRVTQQFVEVLCPRAN